MNFDDLDMFIEMARSESCMTENVQTDITIRDLKENLEKIPTVDKSIEESFARIYSDPDNLRMIHDEATGNYYIEYADLKHYMEAVDTEDMRVAMNQILEHFDTEAPDMTCENFYVVMPGDTTFNSLTESGNLGYDKAVRWSSELLSNTINMGIPALKKNSPAEPGIPEKND